MKHWRQILAFLLAAILTLGTLEMSAVASEDAGTSGPSARAFTSSEESIWSTGRDPAGTEKGQDESSGETFKENRAAGEAAADFAVTLDANGGCFLDAWDDELKETVKRAETLHRLIPAGGKVDVFPLMETEDGKARFLGWSLRPGEELVSQEYEEYVPLQSCTLYAAWEIDEETDESGSDKDMEEETGSQDSLETNPAEDPSARETEEGAVSEEELQEEQDSGEDPEEELQDEQDPGISLENEDTDEEDQSGLILDTPLEAETGETDEEDQSGLILDTPLEAETGETDEEDQSGLPLDTPLETETGEADEDQPDQDAEAAPETDGEGDNSARDPEAALPDTALSDSGESDPAEAEATETGSTEPDPAEAEATETGSTEPDPSEAEATETGSTESNSTESDPAKPDSPVSAPKDRDAEKQSENDKTGDDKDSKTDPAAETRAVEEESVSDEARTFFTRGRLYPGRSDVSVSAGETAYFSFTPVYSGEYEFTGKSDQDTYGYLCDSRQYQLAYNDDGGEGLNFSIKYRLTAGATYYLGVRFYSTSYSGSIPVVIASCGAVGTNNLSVAGGDTAYFSLTPSVSGSYAIYSDTGLDTCGCLYDSNWNLLSTNDDSGYGLNFCISYSLTAGMTYYVGARFYNSSSVGPICVYAGQDMGSCGSSLSWSLGYWKSDSCSRTLTISGSGNMWNYSSSAHDQPWYYARNHIDEIVIGTGVTSIGNAAFTGLSSVGNVTLPSSVVSIGNAAFLNCSGLTGIRIPKSVTSIATNAFQGCSRLTISGYNGTRAQSFAKEKGIPFRSLDKISVSGASVTVTAPTYTGKALKPVPVVKVGTTALKRDTDYQVSYKNNINAGKATLTIKGIGKYTGSKSITFTIKRRSVSKAKVTVPARTYSGKARQPAPTVKVGSVTLKQGRDFAVSYKNNKNAGKATITITGKKNYSGKISAKFTIRRRSLKGAKVTVPARTYSGKAFKPAPTVRLGSVTLKQGRDFTVSYKNNKNAGKATILIKGKKNYTGTLTRKFTIRRRSLKGAKVTVPARTYNGKARQPAPTVKIGSRTLKQGRDFTVSYKNNKNAGKATILIKGKKNYSGTLTRKFTIRRRSLKGAKVTVPARTYNGKARQPAPTVKIGSRTLKQGRDFTVSYRNNKNAGKATILIKGKKNYTGTLTRKFTIRKAAPKLTFSQKSITKEKGNNAFTNKLARKTDGRLTFASSNQKVATVNSSTGRVTIKGKGKAVITVKSAAGKNYKAGKATYKLTVLKAGAFRWFRDNWNFINSSGYFGFNRYIDQINSSYLGKLISALSPSEYRIVFSDEWIYSYWNGSCYGMSASEFLAKEKLLPYGSYQSGATKLYQLNAPVYNSKVSSLITYYQMLQAKDVIQQEFYRAGRRSNRENIQTILRNLDKHSTVVLGFSMKEGGHAILACDYQYGTYNWFGRTYQGCITICDPNSSMAYDRYANIYFNKYTYDWIIPAYRNAMPGRFNFICADKKVLNAGGCLGGSMSRASADYVARMNTYEIQGNHNVAKIRNAGDSYVTFDAGSNDIESAESFVMNGGSGGGTPGYNLYDSSSSYRVTQSPAAPMNLSLKYEDCYLEAESGAGTTLVFDRDGFVEMKGGASDHRLAMTFDRDYPTDWFTVEVSGSSGKRLSLRKTDAGYVVSGERLNDITVCAGNKEETVTGTFSTSAREALICQDADGSLEIRIDADHDGICEKPVTAR